MVDVEQMTVEQLQEEWACSNAKMLERCKEDPHAEKLLQACVDDWQKHRMTEPRKLEMSDLVHGSFSPRFSVEQGADFAFMGLLSRAHEYLYVQASNQTGR